MIQQSRLEKDQWSVELIVISVEILILTKLSPNLITEKIPRSPKSKNLLLQRSSLC